MCKLSPNQKAMDVSPVPAISYNIKDPKQSISHTLHVWNICLDIDPPNHPNVRAYMECLGIGITIYFRLGLGSQVHAGVELMMTPREEGLTVLRRSESSKKKEKARKNHQ